MRRIQTSRTRKNSVNGLITLNSWRMCIVNLLLFASAYILFSVLLSVMPEQMGMLFPQTGTILLAFAAAMLAVGPFRAFLYDEYRRKNILLYSTLIMLAATVGYVFVDSYVGLLLFTSMQGACFGLTTTTDITVATNITASTRRSTGNMVYIWSMRLGMLIGAEAGALLFDFYGFHTVAYLTVTAGAFSMFLASGVYVVFRAPIGMRLCDMDCFLLPRAWVPALDMLLIVFVPRALLPLSYIGDYIVLLALMILVCLTMPFTEMFVKLSHHCQRGMTNTTCYLAIETGFLAGLATTCRLADTYLLYRTAGVATILTISFFTLLTYPYYKKKRAR